MNALFRGFPIYWNGDGIYAFVGGAYVGLDSLTAVEEHMRDGYQVLYVQEADIVSEEE